MVKQRRNLDSEKVDDDDDDDDDDGLIGPRTTSELMRTIRGHHLPTEHYPYYPRNHPYTILSHLYSVKSNHFLLSHSLITPTQGSQ